MFGIIYLNGTLILCMATSAAFFCRKDRLFGIPLPSILLMLGFLLILSYISGATLEGLSGANLREYVMSTRRAFGFIVVEGEDGLLLLFLIFALFSRQVELVIASAATLALVWALTYVNYHGTVSIGTPACLAWKPVRDARVSVWHRLPFLFFGTHVGSGTVRGNLTGAVHRPETAGQADSILADNLLSGDCRQYRAMFFFSISTPWQRLTPLRRHTGRSRQASRSSAPVLTSLSSRTSWPTSSRRAARWIRGQGARPRQVRRSHRRSPRRGAGRRRPSSGYSSMRISASQRFV